MITMNKNTRRTIEEQSGSSSNPQEEIEGQASLSQEPLNFEPANIKTILSPSQPIKINDNLSIDFSESPGYIISNLSDAVAVIKKLYNDGEFNGAQAAICFAFELARKNSHNNDKNELKELYLSSANVLGEMKKYPQALKMYEGYHCLSMQLNSNIFKGTEPQQNITLFQFRRFSDYALANLMKSEITLSRPSVMNDIVDSLVFSWLDSPSFGEGSKYKEHLEPYKESFQDYRIASFCENNPNKNRFAVQNTLMWAHYAAEHSGFCIEYSFDVDEFSKNDFSNNTASRLFRMKYRDPATEPVDFSTPDNTLFTDVAFLTKSIDWSYENEVRLIQYAPKKGALRNQYALSSKSKIVAIYFGARCPEANIQIIKRLLRDRDIRFYRMSIDFSNVHRLKPNEI